MEVTITYQSEHGTVPAPKTVELWDHSTWRWTCEDRGYGDWFHTPNPATIARGMGYYNGELAEVGPALFFVQSVADEGFCIIAFDPDDDSTPPICVWDNGDETFKLYSGTDATFTLRYGACDYWTAAELISKD